MCKCFQISLWNLHRWALLPRGRRGLFHSAGAKGKALELSSSSCVPEKCVFQLTRSVFHSCFSLLSVGPEPGLRCSQPQLPHTPFAHAARAKPSCGAQSQWESGILEQGWGRQGKEGEDGNAPGHAATGLGPCTVRDVPSSQTCSNAFQRELLPELGCSSALPVLDKQNYCFHYSDLERF